MINLIDFFYKITEFWIEKLLHLIYYYLLFTYMKNHWTHFYLLILLSSIDECFEVSITDGKILFSILLHAFSNSLLFSTSRLMGVSHLMFDLIAFVRIFIAFIHVMSFYFCSILSYSLLEFSSPIFL